MTLLQIKRPVRPKLARKTYELTPQEASELRSLREVPGEAFKFWKRVAERCVVDPSTIIGITNNRSKFTALPFGHGKWWCWPSALECAHKPVL
jgi:hypothetical protein